MDAESGELFLGAGDGVAADSWQLDAPFSCSELIFSDSEKPLQDWARDPDCVSLRFSMCVMVQVRLPDAVCSISRPSDSLSDPEWQRIGGRPSRRRPKWGVSQRAACRPLIRERQRHLWGSCGWESRHHGNSGDHPAGPGNRLSGGLWHQQPGRREDWTWTRERDLHRARWGKVCVRVSSFLKLESFWSLNENTNIFTFLNQLVRSVLRWYSRYSQQILTGLLWQKQVSESEGGERNKHFDVKLKKKRGNIKINK